MIFFRYVSAWYVAWCQQIGRETWLQFSAAQDGPPLLYLQLPSLQSGLASVFTVGGTSILAGPASATSLCKPPPSSGLSFFILERKTCTRLMKSLIHSAFLKDCCVPDPYRCCRVYKDELACRGGGPCAEGAYSQAVDGEAGRQFSRIPEDHSSTIRGVWVWHS